MNYDEIFHYLYPSSPIHVDSLQWPLLHFFQCNEIHNDSQFLNMALKAEWLTQHDLCDYGKSVRLCLPGTIVTNNPQLIKPNSAFCLSVKPFFWSFQSQTASSNYTMKHVSFVKTERRLNSAVAKLAETVLRLVNNSACICFTAHLICLLISEIDYWRAGCQKCNNTLSIHSYVIAIFHFWITHHRKWRWVTEREISCSASWDGSAEGNELGLWHMGRREIAAWLRMCLSLVR